MPFKKIVIGSDHAGFEMKEKLVAHLKSLGLDLEDAGTGSSESCDYPEFGEKVARAVASGAADAGVLVCGSGIGMSMAANKVAGVRALVCDEPLSARMSRLHNNANVLCLGGRMIGVEMAKEILNVWLNTEFEGGRHQRRVELLDDILTRNS
jgi:ribose 5-phosphate isomerase B